MLCVTARWFSSVFRSYSNIIVRVSMIGEFDHYMDGVCGDGV